MSNLLNRRELPLFCIVCKETMVSGRQNLYPGDMIELKQDDYSHMQGNKVPSHMPPLFVVVLGDMWMLSFA